MPESKIRSLTSGSLLARNTIYSLVGQGLPLIVAIFSIPLLIKEIGVDRFGILTIAWIIIGYFSLFDLGLGRALTQLVAEKLGSDKSDELPQLIWTASLLMILLGIFGTVVLIVISPWLVYSALKIPPELQTETLQSFNLLALSIPFVTSTAGFVGVLSALQRFDLINYVRIPSGLLMYLGPLAILPWSKNLIAIISVLLITRFCTWGIHISQCLHCLPGLSHQKFAFQQKSLKPLLRFGGWMTITNIVGPVMVYLDRFLIGSILSVTAVAYYTTPYELITKLHIIPSAIVSVLFPAFSSTFLIDKEQTTKLFYRGLKYIFIILFPVISLISFLANSGLKLWLGADFAQNSTFVLQWLAFGMLFNSFAQIPFAFIQGIGRPDVTSKIHLFELPLYLLVLTGLTARFGINGAAVAWVLRVIIDVVILYVVSCHFFQIKFFTHWKNLMILSLVVVVMFSTFLLPFNETFKVSIFCLSIGVYLFATWRFLLNEDERTFIAKRIKFLENLN
jgi:O-antigen/teichoic acid export membrane protein